MVSVLLDYQLDLDVGVLLVEQLYLGFKGVVQVGKDPNREGGFLGQAQSKQYQQCQQRWDLLHGFLLNKQIA